MKVRTDEIVTVLKKEIESFESALQLEEVGTITEVGDGIAHIYGLNNAMSGEMLDFGEGIFGQAFNIEEKSVGAIILGDYLKLKEGDRVKRTGRMLAVPVGEALIGRVLDPLGNPLDGLGPVRATKERPIESPAPGIADRQPVFEPLQTGLKAIDSMIPIGRGQRELIIGDRGTGKTAIAVDTIINQKGQGVICVYVAIGQKASTVAGVVDRLRAQGAMDYTIVVCAASSAPAPLQYIAPYSGCAIAEYFMYEQKKPTLVVYDDLSKQATAYRQLSLLLRRPPGREAYPGDIFYCHSRLLERSAKLSDDLGGGSMTALPVIETQEGEVSAYIPTNVISITDGQIYLTPELFYSGIRPAINVGISVSRVGGKAQIPAMKAKSVAGGLKLQLARYWSLEAFAQLGTELDKTTQAALDRGKRMVALLKQDQYQPMSVENQVIVITAGTTGALDAVPLDKVAEFEKGLLQRMKDAYPEIPAAIRTEKKMNEATAKALEKAIAEFKDSFRREMEKGAGAPAAAKK